MNHCFYNIQICGEAEILEPIMNIKIIDPKEILKIKITIDVSKSSTENTLTMPEPYDIIKEEKGEKERELPLFPYTSLLAAVRNGNLMEVFFYTTHSIGNLINSFY